MKNIAAKRILVIEDEFLIALYATEMLEEMGNVPLGPAGSVEAAFAMIAELEIDAALLDLNLQGRPGEEVAEELQRRGIPFLITSGYDNKAGGDRPFLAKPYTAAALASELKKLLA